MAKRALCIGINDYPGTDSDLSGCVNDARDWAKVLTRRDFQVESMFNQTATTGHIRHAIEALVNDARKGDSLVIQYSGHGSFVPDLDGDEPDGNDECLCPYDVEINGPITDDELYEIFSQAQKGVKVLMVSDSCHSGTVTRFAPITLPISANHDQYNPLPAVRFLPPSSYLPKSDAELLKSYQPAARPRPSQKAPVLLLAGCQDDEYSFDAYFLGRPNGVFTYVAIRALSKLPPDATYADWFKQIRQSLPSRQYPQTPNLHGSAAMKKWKVLA